MYNISTFTLPVVSGLKFQTLKNSVVNHSKFLIVTPTCTGTPSVGPTPIITKTSKTQ